MVAHQTEHHHRRVPKRVVLLGLACALVYSVALTLACLVEGRTTGVVANGVVASIVILLMLVVHIRWPNRKEPTP